MQFKPALFKGELYFSVTTWCSRGSAIRDVDSNSHPPLPAYMTWGNLAPRPPRPSQGDGNNHLNGDKSHEAANPGSQSPPPAQWLRRGQRSSMTSLSPTPERHQRAFHLSCFSQTSSEALTSNSNLVISSNELFMEFRVLYFFPSLLPKSLGEICQTFLTYRVFWWRPYSLNQRCPRGLKRLILLLRTMK